MANANKVIADGIINLVEAIGKNGKNGVNGANGANGFNGFKKSQFHGPTSVIDELQKRVDVKPNEKGVYYPRDIHELEYIRGQVLLNKSSKGFGKVISDGQAIVPKNKAKGGYENITYKDIRFNTAKNLKKSATKRNKAINASKISEKKAIAAHMKYKKEYLGDDSPFNANDAEAVADYMETRSRQMRDYKTEIKTDRVLGLDVTDGHLTVPTDPTAVDSITQRFKEPGKDYIDENGDLIKGNFSKQDKDGDIDEAMKALLGIANSVEDDYFIYRIPELRGIRPYISDDSIHLLQNKKDFNFIFKKEGIKGSPFRNK